jgi:transcriptional regulator with XRE-family HTH domain
LARVALLQDAVGPATVGQRLRRLRTQQGTSIRMLAEAAGIAKSSIVRIEQGMPGLPLTVLRICEALGLHVERAIGRPTESSAPVAVHRAADERWYVLEDAAGAPLGSARRPPTAAERARLRADATVLVGRFDNQLPQGRLFAAQLEVYGWSELRRHVGEECVVVLSGRLLVEVSGETYTLNAGDSITFWSAEPHRYGRARGSKGPARAIVVRADG